MVREQNPTGHITMQTDPPDRVDFPDITGHPRSHRRAEIDAATRLAYRVQQVGNERIGFYTSLLQPGRANRAKLEVFGRHGERGKAISAAR